ncbi:hypothetical protein JCM10213v2_007620 [Rhodosporidiobolus nylandii]
MKTLEWAFVSGAARDRDIAWIGFEGKTEEKLHGNRGTRPDDVASSSSSSTAAQAGTAIRNRLNGVIAPRPIHPPPLPNPATLAPPGGASVEPQQLPTPSPSPPFSAVKPPSVKESATPSSRLTPLAHAKADALKTSQRAHPLRLIADSTHLLTSMRGVGYAWGPPLRSLPDSAPSHAEFAKRAFVSFLKAHVVATLCLALEVYHRDALLTPALSSLLPSLFPSASSAFETADLLARLSIGICMFMQMLVGFEGINMLFLVLSYTTNAALDAMPKSWGWTWRAVFDTREYPPLFDEPFGKMGEGGVSSFWGKRWHALFRSSFTALGFAPSIRLARRLRLPSTVGKLLGAFVVFGLSGWMHWQALYSARLTLSPSPSALAYASDLSISHSSLYPAPWSTLSFTERHGTSIFFLLQPIAVALEAFWTAFTRRKIGGWTGRVWTMLWIVVLGQAMVGRSWLALGLVHGLPPVHLWSWHRWLLPSVGLAPMPVLMRT